MSTQSPDAVETDSGQLLKPTEAAAHLKVSASYLAKLRLAGTGPAFLKLSRSVVRYRAEDLGAWAASRARQSTSQPG